MRLKHLLFLFALGLLAYACNSGAATEEAKDKTEETTEQEASGEEASEATASETAYEITVLDDTKPSPRKEMKGTIGDGAVSVNYGSPKMKGRTIFGELVPWGKVWRSGANEASRVTFENDVMVEGQALAAGTYAFFLIPQEEGAWTVIFNKEAEQWGAYEYKEAEDALRVEVSPVDPEPEASAEEMDFTMDAGKLQLHWDKTVVPVAVTAAS
ncbi:MAG: DUF2911 domain-containing protein [Bacteroidota bacterium]